MVAYHHLRSIESLVTLLSSTKDGSGIMINNGTMDFERRLSFHNIQDWVVLARLFYRPWFERLWVIQELAVSKSAIAVWGKPKILWHHIERAARYILRPGTPLPPPHLARILPFMGAHRVTQVALSSMLNVDTKDILTILHNTQGTMCTDPRDRLYAILGIVDDSEAQDVEIDYSISVQEVYCNWARKRIQRTSSLDILSACTDSGRSGDLPSWVRLPY